MEVKPIDINAFKQKYGVTFQNNKLLIQAFTHSSYANEHRTDEIIDNERLEFLGDAVLELTISQYLYEKYIHMSEGELSKFRAAIVCEESLFHFAEELQLNDFILLGKGEERTRGRNRPALLADVFEAFLGAMYLDQGIDTTVSFLERTVFPKIDAGAFSHVMDFKSQLQEQIQRDGSGILEYKILEERGPAHSREFISEVTLNNTLLGRGSGRSKKEAEQHAAQMAIGKLNQKERN